MDEFEKEYFGKLAKIAVDFKGSRSELAKSRIKLFSASICRQLIERNEKFDILLGSGNSGLFMTTIARMVYESLKKEIPPTLNLPVYRFRDDGTTIDSNPHLLPEIKTFLQDLPKIKSVLFVDDEIMRAITSHVCFDLILQASPSINNLNTTIIAENHFFEWHYKMPKVSVNFFAHARLIQGFNGNIGYFIPPDIYEKVSLQINEVRVHNHAMALIVGGGLKRKDSNGIAYFDFDIESTLKAGIEKYDERKSYLIRELRDLIGEGIKEYETKKIKFRF